MLVYVYSKYVPVFMYSCVTVFVCYYYDIVLLVLSIRAV